MATQGRSKPSDSKANDCEHGANSKGLSRSEFSRAMRDIAKMGGACGDDFLAVVDQLSEAAAQGARKLYPIPPEREAMIQKTLHRARIAGELPIPRSNPKCDKI